MTEQNCQKESLWTLFYRHFRRLVELERDGLIGGLAETHYSFSYVNNVLPLVEESLPNLVNKLREQEVTALLAVPV